VVVNAANVIRSAAERRRREAMNRMVFVVWLLDKPFNRYQPLSVQIRVSP
jgi:hypothetical protein